MESYRSGEESTTLSIFHDNISDKFIEIPRHIERVEINGAVMHNTTFVIKPRRIKDGPIGLFSISNVDGYGANIIAEETNLKNEFDIKQLRFGTDNKRSGRRSRLPGFGMGTSERPISIQNALLFQNTDFTEMEEHKMYLFAPKATINFKNTDLELTDLKMKHTPGIISWNIAPTPIYRDYMKPSHTR
jgi:hypothetical protein